MLPPPANGSKTAGNPPPRGARGDLRPSPRQHLRVVAVLPQHQLLNQPEQPLPLRILGLRGGKPIRPRQRIVHQRSEKHRPTRRQRTPGPPQMQSRGMPMADRLLPSRRRIDGIQRQRHLNQLPHEYLLSHQEPTLPLAHNRARLRLRLARCPTPEPNWSDGLPR